MEITRSEITIREVFEGYNCEAETGRVVGFSGKLDIRPAYQREFVYNDKQQKAVIETIMKGFPLSVIYWAKNEDGTFEVLDGQQRTISICKYVNGDFSIDFKGFHNQPKDIQDKILDYKLDVYQIEGTESEKLECFKIINIPGVKLSDQELRNAAYTGPWLSDAKRYFSKSRCAAYELSKHIISVKVDHQELLEVAIRWYADKEKLSSIEECMARHQHDEKAEELWRYFKAVIEWVNLIFPKARKEMKNLEWGIFYNKYLSNGFFSPEQMEEEIKVLMEDEDITKKSGIYEYLLSHKTVISGLSLRSFPDKIKRECYEKQQGICPHCAKNGIDKVYTLEEMEADHITPWSKGGKTTLENCQMLCKEHNRVKSDV